MDIISCIYRSVTVEETFSVSTPTNTRLSITEYGSAKTFIQRQFGCCRQYNSFIRVKSDNTSFIRFNTNLGEATPESKVTEAMANELKTNYLSAVLTGCSPTDTELDTVVQVGDANK